MTDPPLTDLYRVAVEETRFQVQFNWNRVQYLTSLSALLLTAGVALDRPLAALVFAFGAVESLVTRTLVATQHDYYRAARDRMVHIADRAALGDLRVATTPGAGGPPRHGPSVTTWLRFLLLGLAVAHVVGAVVVLVSPT